MEPTEPAAGRCVGQLVISVALSAMALVTSPDRRFLQPRRSGRLRDPRLASFVRWDTIGASRVRPLDVSSPQAPARPGLSFALCVSAVFGLRGTPRAALPQYGGDYPGAAQPSGAVLSIFVPLYELLNSLRCLNEIAPEPAGHGLPLSKCEAYNRVYEQPCGSS